MQILKKLCKTFVNNGLSQRAASKKFHIPRSTLMDILKGKSSVTIKPKGREPYLAKKGKDQIYEWITKSAACGFPVKIYRLLLTISNKSSKN